MCGSKVKMRLELSMRLVESRGSLLWIHAMLLTSGFVSEGPIIIGLDLGVSSVVRRHPTDGRLRCKPVSLSVKTGEYRHIHEFGTFESLNAHVNEWSYRERSGTITIHDDVDQQTRRPPIKKTPRRSLSIKERKNDDEGW